MAFGASWPPAPDFFFGNLMVPTLNIYSVGIYHLGPTRLVNSKQLASILHKGTQGREPSAQMGHGPRRLVSGAYAMPPWVPIEVKIDQKWKRAFVLRQADHRGLCLVRVTGTPDAEPVMVPLSTIRLPSRVHRAKRRPETAMQIQVKKARIEQSSDDEE
ncbi:hypothetical protein OsI_24289 [Oryza sativa Indica Group]|uniref:Uncharacterized protein n=1 Tax=Oryza sativa subsp. indica TaxID=39946 RepID=B8B1V9_ORYSI|nr:hypothetical protein OsI_24289 [Oryza sativa Indica Group]